MAGGQTRRGPDILVAGALVVAACFTDAATNPADPDGSSGGSESATASTTVAATSIATSNTSTASTVSAETDTLSESGTGPSTTTIAGSAGSTGSTGVPCGAECTTGRCNAEGDCLRYVFVTDRAYPSSFGGVDNAHELCTAEAEPFLPGRYLAFVRDDTDPDPWFNIQSDAIPDARFVLPNGDTVAASPDQLRIDTFPAEDLSHEINRTAADEVIAGSGDACLSNPNRVWTGLRREDDCMWGQADCLAVPAGDCGEWLASGSDNAGTGAMTRRDQRWAASGPCGCEDGITSPRSAHFYCFQAP